MRRLPASDPDPEISRTRLAIAGATGLYFLWWARDPSQWQFLDWVNLLVHEAGHTLFFFFGELLHAAGGSLLQVIMPAAFVIHFLRRGDPYSAGLVLIWAGQSALNVSVYARDAIKMELPLLGGDAVTHDWNYILESMGMLKVTWLVAGSIRVAGTSAILGGMLLSLKFSVVALPRRPAFAEPFERS